jgi:hypothetical protein
MQTKGEYRVGISFNPSQDDAVSRIKRAAADLIDMIEDIAVPPASGDPGAIRSAEICRLKSLAQTAIEDGAMWAVKAATKPERK